MPNDFPTAVAWLASIGPQLERFKAEDAALCDAHVGAWLEAESCANCGDPKPIAHTYRRNGIDEPYCAECFAERDAREREEYRSEERWRKYCEWCANR